MERKRRSPSHRAALLGLFAAMAVVLSVLESALEPLPVAGARLGLANVAVTAAVWLLGVPDGASVAAAKVLFVLLMRGPTAALMACVGTAAAFGATCATLPLCRRERMTFVGVSISASAAHTVGQLLTAVCLMGGAVAAYAPWMLLISVPTGTLTGLVLNVTVVRLAAIRNRF